MDHRTNLHTHAHSHAFAPCISNLSHTSWHMRTHRNKHEYAHTHTHQIMTGDSWAEVIARPCIEVRAYGFVGCGFKYMLLHCAENVQKSMQIKVGFRHSSVLLRPRTLQTLQTHIHLCALIFMPALLKIHTLTSSFSGTPGLRCISFCTSLSLTSS